jgi:hypothetical protein
MLTMSRDELENVIDALNRIHEVGVAAGIPNDMGSERCDRIRPAHRRTATEWSLRYWWPAVA